jgi:hypothetical protein
MEVDSDKKRSLRDIESDLNYFSTEASKITRNLVLLGFGIIWVFKEQLQNSLFLKISMFLLFLSVVTDLSHYINQTLKWDSILKQAEKTGKKSDDLISVPKKLTKWTERFFYTKIVLGISAYILFIIFFTIHFFL